MDLERTLHVGRPQAGVHRLGIDHDLGFDASGTAEGPREESDPCSPSEPTRPARVSDFRRATTGGMPARKATSREFGLAGRLQAAEFDMALWRRPGGSEATSFPRRPDERPLVERLKNLGGQRERDRVGPQSLVGAVVQTLKDCRISRQFQQARRDLAIGMRTHRDSARASRSSGHPAVSAGRLVEVQKSSETGALDPVHCAELPSDWLEGLLGIGGPTGLRFARARCSIRRVRIRVTVPAFWSILSI